MATIKQMSQTYSSKKEITDLPSLDVNLEVMEGTFESNGKTVKYNYVEIDGYKYTIKAKALEAIRTVVNVRPQTTKVKLQVTPKGEYVAFPLD